MKLLESFYANVAYFASYNVLRKAKIARILLSTDLRTEGILRYTLEARKSSTSKDQSRLSFFDKNG